MHSRLWFGLATVGFLLFGCADEDPKSNNDDFPDGSVDNGEECGYDELAYAENVTDCNASATDYMPRENDSADDTWAACISDDDTYHLIEESVSSIARVEAYDNVGDYLWNNSAPTAEDFVNARILFEEEQGLGSRVARRYDPHYDPPAGGESCEDEGVPELYPDYCVGPAVLQPLIVQAFAEGAQGNDLVVNAAKIHAALQWFLYVSSFKEGTTCAESPKDCDSCWAYYSGGTERGAPIGLAAEIDVWAPETHDRAYDGVLAVRCWRDLDQAVPATDTAMQALALDQLDFALLQGMGVLIRQYFMEISCTTGNYQKTALEALRVLIPLFDRETRERDASVADLLESETAKDAADVNVTAAMDAIDEIYPCP